VVCFGQSDDVKALSYVEKNDDDTGLGMKQIEIASSETRRRCDVVSGSDARTPNAKSIQVFFPLSIISGKNMTSGCCR
jgi:hypothetical protein